MFPPAQSCDCHVHVIGPKDRFPLAIARSYTPMDAPIAPLQAMLRRIGVTRVVLVQPSFYGTDNDCMLDAMAALDQARGVAVLPDSVPRAALDDMHRRGVRGLRVNVATGGSAPLDTMTRALNAAASLCEPNGWHVQAFVPSSAIEALAPAIGELPVPVVIDHFGLLTPGETGAARDALRRLLATGKIWVKISGAYRIADDPNDPRVGPLARTLCDANPDRIVWGSDWPHTPRHDVRSATPGDETPFQTIDTRGLLDLVPRWLNDDALVQKVLIDNPARLYDF